MRKPFKTGVNESAEPATVAATLVAKHPDRLTALCGSGILYHWMVNPSKQSALNALQEGDLVFVNYNQVTGEVFSIVKQA